MEGTYVLVVDGKITPACDPKLANLERREAEIVKINRAYPPIVLKIEGPLTKSKIVLIGCKNLTECKFLSRVVKKDYTELIFVSCYELSIGNDIIPIEEKDLYLWKSPPGGILHDHKVGDILIFSEI